MCSVSPAIWDTITSLISRTPSLHHYEIQVSLRNVLPVDPSRIYNFQFDILNRRTDEIILSHWYKEFSPGFHHVEHKFKNISSRSNSSEVYSREERDILSNEWGYPVKIRERCRTPIDSPLIPTIYLLLQYIIQEIRGRLNFIPNDDWSFLRIQNTTEDRPFTRNSDNWMIMKLNNVTLQVHSNNYAKVEDSDLDTSN